MAKKDYYRVLAVDRGASADQIRKAYRKLARKYHPDVNRDDPQAETRFKEVQEAYDVLSDKQKRSAYDQFGFAGAGGGAGGWQPGPGGARYSWSGSGAPEGFDVGDLGDLFEMFTGQGRGFGDTGRPGRPHGRPGRRARPEPAPAAGADIRQEVSLSFEEAARGATREVRLAGPAGQQTIRVKIPPGVDDAAKIRIRGKGHPAPDGRGRPGDLYIIPRVQPHPHFRREGLNVLLEVPVTVAEAALGARIEVPTLNGRVELTVPAGTAGGSRLRLKGLGIAPPGGKGPGDQIVLVRIVLPDKLDERSRDLLEQFDRLNPHAPRKDLGW